MPDYAHIPIDVYMSRYGYWVVTISVGPGQRLSTMIVKQGISPDQAIEAALGSVPAALAQAR